jgi:serine/threonine-protein phosphatase 2B catalytic subunit
VPEPAWQVPHDSQFYLFDERGGRRPDHEFLKDHFFREGRLTEPQALFILQEATAVLQKEQNMLEVAGPVTSASSVLYDRETRLTNSVLP